MKNLIAANFNPMKKSLKQEMAKSLTLFRDAPRGQCYKNTTVNCHGKLPQ
jgi:hypothetical protein